MNSKYDPFVHTFSTARNDYLYDVNTNLICKISHESKEILMHNAAYNDELIGLKNAGVLKEKPVTMIQHPYNNQLEEMLHTKLNRLVLQLTQQCNLRCHYCVYSENYQGTRMHSGQYMSINTLRASIDFLAANSDHCEEVHIGFYGGEPLLRFDLIQEVFLYAERIFANKTVSYSMTTNAVMLSEEIIRSMVAHNVAIQISIDGPEKIHDKNRRNALGEGSFKKVIENLEIIHQNYPRYYREKITFNAVFDGSCTYDDLLPFFTTHHLFRDNFVKISGLNTAIPNNLCSYPELKDARILSSRKNAVLFYYKSISDPQYIPNKTLEQLFSFWMVENGLKRQPLPLFSEHIHYGLCIPGVSRLFVSTDGTFHVCEKVSEECNGPTCIGNLASGFDLTKVRALMNLQNSSDKGCSECWAIQLCRVCAAMINMQDNNWEQALNQLCNSSREALERQLIDYCTYCELKKIYQIPTPLN